MKNELEEEEPEYIKLIKKKKTLQVGQVGVIV
jgi:hypothetical protein